MSLFLVSVAARDETGALAWVTSNLARWEVNLKGFVADKAGMQLLVTDVTNLSAALDEMGFMYNVSEVEEVILEDRPGALASLCQALADEGISILTAFGVATGQSGRIYLKVDDLEHAAPILSAHNDGPAILHKRLGRIPMTTR